VQDPKRIVEEGYDRIVDRYAEWSSQVGADTRARYLGIILDALSPGADVLELGCGPGGPTTCELAARFRLTAVDISGGCVARARVEVPGARFIHCDMTRLDLPFSSWDAIVAFYSILHVPRDEHAALFSSFAAWLRPGGLLVASFGARDSDAGYEPDWLGTPMYWSGHEPEVEREMIRAAGFAIERAAIETIDEDGQPTPFLWVVARRGMPDPGGGPAL
jgi:SAM-dependent methyltransferase